MISINTDSNEKSPTSDGHDIFQINDTNDINEHFSRSSGEGITKNGVIFWKIPFHTIGAPQKRHLRIKFIPSIDEKNNAKKSRESLSPFKSRRIQPIIEPPDKKDKPRTNVVLQISHIVDDKSSQNRNDEEIKEIRLFDIKRVYLGLGTPAFKAYLTKYGNQSIPSKQGAFSLVLQNRTFDFVACDEATSEALIFRDVLIHHIQHTNESFLLGKDPSAPIITDVMNSYSLTSKLSVTPIKRKELVWDEKSLFIAVRSGNLKDFELILENRCPVDLIEKSTGDTPLIVACRLGRYNIVECALNYQAKNDPHPNYGQTALQAAVSCGQTLCVRLLLQTAAPSKSDEIIVNHEDSNKEAPLHVACRCGNFDILELLLMHGAHLHSVDAEARTCLHCAAQGGHSLCLAYLLDVGGDALVEERDCHGNTCLHTAVKCGEEQCVKLLLEIAVDIRSLTPDGLNSYQIAVTRRKHSVARLLLEFEPQLGCNHSSFTNDSIKNSSHAYQRFDVPSKQFNPSQNLDLPRPWTTTSSMIKKPKQPSSNFYKGLDLFTISCGESFKHDHSNTFAGVCSSRSNIFTTPYLSAESEKLLQNYPSQIVNGYTSDPRINANEYNFGPQFTASSPINNFKQDHFRRYPESRHMSERETFSSNPSIKNALRPFNSPIRKSAMNLPICSRLASQNFDIQNRCINTIHKQTKGSYFVDNVHNSQGYSSDSKAMLHNKSMIGKSHVPFIKSPSADNDYVDYLTTRDSFVGNRKKQETICNGYDTKTKKVHTNRRLLVIGSARDAATNEIYSIKEFTIKNEKWHIHYHSQNQYFLRTKDNYSVWDDPRIIKKTKRKSKPKKQKNKKNAEILLKEEQIDQMDDSVDVKETPSKFDVQCFQNSNSEDMVQTKQSYEAPSVSLPLPNTNTTANAKCIGKEDKNISESIHDEKENHFGESILNLNHDLLREGLKNLRRSHGSVHSKSPDLVVGENLNLTKYVKMIKVGVPKQSVLHKMTQDGINARTQALFEKDLDSNNDHIRSKQCATSKQIVGEVPKPKKKVNEKEQLKESYPELINYLKMISVGVPLSSALHKMKLDGIESILIEKVKNAHSSMYDKPINKDKIIQLRESICVEDDKIVTKERLAQNHPELAKYFKMVSVGVPIQSTLHKMNQDGVNNCYKDKFKQALSSNLPTEKQSKESKLRRLTKENLRKDSILCKYIQMESMGVPLQGVVHKMILDRVSSDKLEMFRNVYNLPDRNSDLGEVQNVPSTSRRASVALQKIHWNAVSEKNLHNSLWAEKDKEDEELDHAEIKELESLFGAKPKSVSKNQNQTTKKSKACVNLIDLKRANNVAIALAQFRNFNNYDDLCRSVVIQDTDRLDMEKLQNMVVLLPSAAEIKAISGYRGDLTSLGKAELFFIAVSKIPRFSTKLHAFNYSLQFEEQIEFIHKFCKLLHRSCLEVVKSRKLAGMLRRLLAVGNLMNESTGQPKAAGITLDSLIKTAKKKGSDGKTTVLDHIVAMLMKQGEQDGIIDYWTEMPSVKESIKLDINDCNAGFRDVQANVKRIQAAIMKEKNSVDSQNEQNHEIKLFVEKSEIFVNKANIILKDVEHKMKKVEEGVNSLCKYFAEDPKSIQASSIFTVLVDFSKLVDKSKEDWQRRERLRKRKNSVAKKNLSNT